MPIVVGIDEAGYGPLLGPLVLGASIWEVDAERVGCDFWEALSDSVIQHKSRSDFRLRVDDSKKVYDRKAGLAPLERTVLAFAGACGAPCDSLGSFLNALAGDASLPSATRPPLGADATVPWYTRLDRKLPTDPVKGAFESMAKRLAAAMKAAGISCRALGIQLVTEDAFNRRVQQTRNKAAVIVEHVLKLITRALRFAGDRDLHFLIDRLGGRSNYRGILQTAFPDRFLRIIEVSDERSRYRLSRFDDGAVHPGDWTFEFTVEADSRHLPVALAGMLCKYCRELLMYEFNAYWRKLDPTLRPTAGYYSDAKRFLSDIDPLLSRSGLSHAEFVRAR